MRQRHKLTQAALADKLGTTQQTIQRWETNKTSIPSKALKELAIVFDCSVDELLGIAEYSRTRYSTWFLTKSEKKGRRKLVGYYGGVYLTLQGVPKIQNYPIDDIAAKTIKNSFPVLENGSLGLPWMCFETMDNRILFVNLKAVKVAEVYTDDYECAPAFEHPEVYRFLTEWNIDEIENGITASEIAEQEGISENLAEKAIGIIMHYEKTEEENWSGISFHSVNIYWLDGEKTSHYLDRKLWWDLDDIIKIYNVPELYYSDTDEIPSGTIFIQEGTDEDAYINFLNLDHIALIEVPAIKYWQIACEDSPDLLDIRDISPYMPHKNNNQ
ncbi:MAG: helix-turn-helix transcriptional regulator [Calothrix sp. MO_192.B10]|nr:helix-turn-helix transcriptional regulator [Calothrix sp. MO_192.B10]